MKASHKMLLVVRMLAVVSRVNLFRPSFIRPEAGTPGPKAPLLPPGQLSIGVIGSYWCGIDYKETRMFMIFVPCFFVIVS